MNTTKLENLRVLDISECLNAFESRLRGILPPQNIAYTAFAAAYVFILMQEQGYPECPELSNFLAKVISDEETRAFLLTALTQKCGNVECWDLLKDMHNIFPASIHQAFLLFGIDSFVDGESFTPTSISRLSVKILGIQSQDSVCDFCCGMGAFLREAYFDCIDAEFSGKEINTRISAIAKIRGAVLGGKISIETCDVLERLPEKKYDKIFSQPPFGVVPGNDAKLKNAIAHIPEVSTLIRPSSQLAFVILPVLAMKKNGKSVIITSLGSMINMIDAPLRQYLLTQGLIEAVIELPTRLFVNTAIAAVMIIISSENETVRMVNAREFCEKGRRISEITSDNIERIMTALETDSEISRSVTHMEIAEKNFNLLPSRYTEQVVYTEETVALGDLITAISRGAPLSASELDEMISEQPTDIQYLTLGNIQNGIIDSDLPYLKSIDNRYERFLVAHDSLLLSKNGSPFKVAIPDVEDGKKIIANGNMFIISVDEAKVDPFYIKAFLESKIGCAALKSLSKGSTIPTISVEDVKRIRIPLAPMAEQVKLRKRYKSTVEKIQVLRRQLEKESATLNDLFESVTKSDKL